MEPAPVIVPPAGAADAARCPVPHGAVTPLMTPTGQAPATVAPGCPVAHDAPAPTEAPATGSCPVAHRAAPTEFGPADRFVRRLLRIRTAPQDLSDAKVYKSFQRSMLISAIRCTLTYVVFPVVSNGLSFVHGFGPWFGIFIGVFALTCDTFTIRRFFVANHRYRWVFSAIAFSIMCFLMVLLVQDVSHIISRA